MTPYMCPGKPICTPGELAVQETFCESIAYLGKESYVVDWLATLSPVKQSFKDELQMIHSGLQELLDLIQDS